MTIYGQMPRPGTRIGLLPGTFNPPTVAHVALGEAARKAGVDHVLLVMPGRLPHKSWSSGATREQRLTMLQRICEARSGMSAAISPGGLYIEIAENAAAVFPENEIVVVCGRDAAERILTWQYDEPDVPVRFLQRFPMLVAARQGSFQPPEPFAGRITTLEHEGPEECAATAIRERHTGCEHWILPEIRDLVEAIYWPAVASRNVRKR